MKKYSTSLVLFCVGIISFSLYVLSPSYIGKDGILVEAFGYIPLGYFFIVTSFLIAFGISTWKLFHNPTSVDRWMFGVSTTFLAFVVSYILTLLLLTTLR